MLAPARATTLFWLPAWPGRPLFLPLFPTQEGGEGWGEEEFFPGWPLSNSLPTRASRGERGNIPTAALSKKACGAASEAESQPEMQPTREQFSL